MSRRWTGLVATAALMATATTFAGQKVRAQGRFATGIVFEDRDGDGVRDANETGLSGIRVSNGLEIVRTDRRGRWKLPVGEDTGFFVIKPQGWMTPLDANNLPKFSYIHKPAGSPKLRYEGVKPTGPLPSSIDFALHRQREPDKFRAIFFGDPQPRDQKEIDYISHDVVEELIGTDASFGVSLGDVMFDNLSLYDSLNGSVALIGIPWYNVLGNHDINYDAPNDELSDETWERVYGPAYYSFDHGQAHFVVLDDVRWSGRTPTDPGKYTAALGPKQLQWLKNDLALVPDKKLIVLMMHIPLTGVEDRQEVYRLIEKRPFTLSVSGHTHYQEHKLITSADGWRGPKPHHHVINVTVSGSWWSGAPDERGIPHTTMRCGAPNGYSIFTFDGNQYSLEFKASGRSRDYQMNIYAPESIEAHQAPSVEVLANVFGGSEKSKVEMRFDGGEWSTMEKVAKFDPAFLAMKVAEASSTPPPGRKLPAVIPSPHLWRGSLPRRPALGVRRIEVRTTDMFGQSYQASRAITVR